MIKISRIAHLTLATSDFDRQLDHYERVIGLRTVHRESGTAYLTTKLGQLALVLKSEKTPNCTNIGFELAPNADLTETRRWLAERDVVSEIRTDVYPGIESLIAFADPKGSTIELFSNSPFHQPGAIKGIGPHKLGHLAFVVDSPHVMACFYGDILGFRVSDWVEDFFVFMRCNPDHHTVNFLQGKPTRLHHVAFELRDAAHLVESCEVLAHNSTRIIWGPVRHGPGHNMATYHRDAAGQIIELFAELDRMSDESLGFFDPKPWHANRPQYPRTWPKNERRDIWGPQIPKDFL
jgi:catechol 2,3-dioxygenase-like lactoylglutathione lyase family enzyme